MMGKIGILALAICLASTLAVRPALADDPGPANMTLEVGGSLGLFLPSASHEFYQSGTPHVALSSAGFDLAARVGFYPIVFAGVEGELGFIPIGAKEGSGAKILAFRVHAIGQFPIGRIVPFGLWGFGAMKSSSSNLGDDTDGITYLGVGVKYYLRPHLNLRFDARLIRAPKFEDDPRGVGTNHGEILLGAAWSFGGGGESAPVEPVAEPDADDDGVIDRLDDCPKEPGVAPTGCPAKDSDNDGLLDDVDLCPDKPENINGYKDDDGCPDDDPDSDGDGIPDKTDECPSQPEDKDGFEDENGCPDDDNDNDGVVDTADNCPIEAGVVENRGCPDTDRDGDGVVDRLDNCPDEPGTPANAGCKKKQLVTITNTQIKILDKVYFRVNRATIQRKSNKLLDNVAAVLGAHAEIKKVRIEGHTDDQGEDGYNKTLSQDRAQAVLDYLVKKGVEADRLEAVGFGEEKPIADNVTKKGREDNRRVEFNIVD